MTVYALVILFAVYAFLDAIMQGARAFCGLRAAAVIGRLLLTLVDVAAGIAAILYPDHGGGAGADHRGLGDRLRRAGAVRAFGAGETAGARAWFVVGGLLSIIFGTLLATRPDVGAISLALIFGIYSLAFGVAQIVLGVQARRAAGTAAGRLAAA